LRLIDSHAHLDEQALSSFVAQIDSTGLQVISDSVGLESSMHNLELGKRTRSIIPFVGIHPEIFRAGSKEFRRVDLDSMVSELEGLLRFGKGVGEIGLDPSYGHFEDQEYLLEKILSICEERNLPITFHCRETVARILEFVSTYKIGSKLLFHWFSGSEEELRKLHDVGAYISFGPSILFSKRMAGLVQSSDIDLVLAETDSPTFFRSISDAASTPLLTPSVVFKMGLILNMSFDKVAEKLEINTNEYLSTQH
jgi:TatD DNase family protein